MKYTKTILSQVPLLMALLISSCSSNSKTSSINQGNSVKFEHDISTSFASTNSNVKVIFNGQNNTVTFKSRDSKFESKDDRSAIVIEGDNNNLTFTRDGVIDRSVGARDTLVIKGSDNTLDFNEANSVDDSRHSQTNRYLSSNKNRKTYSSMNYLLVDNEYDMGLVVLQNYFKDYSEAYPYFDSIAQEGNAEYQFYLGQIHHYGLDTNQNCPTAINWYLKSAENDFSKSMFMLGYIHEFAECGIREDLDKAKYWYEKAKELGSRIAQTRLEQL